MKKKLKLKKPKQSNKQTKAKASAKAAVKPAAKSKPSLRRVLSRMKKAKVSQPKATTASVKQTAAPPPKRASVPRTAKQYFKLSEASQEKWSRVAHVVSKMRADKISLQQASTEFGVDPRVVARLAKSALRKGSKGRYQAKEEDNLLRVLVIPGTDGLTEVAVKGSRQASLIGQYSDAVQKYLWTGDASKLKKFSRKRLKDADGKTVRFLTDLEQLNRQGSAGVLSFESLYARTA